MDSNLQYMFVLEAPLYGDGEMLIIKREKKRERDRQKERQRERQKERRAMFSIGITLQG